MAKNKEDRDPQYRNICFTWNNYDSTPKDNPDWWKRFNNLQYGICQLEKAPTTGQLHLQGYLEFEGARRVSTLKQEILGAHLEKRLGSQKQAIDYCKKSRTQVEGYWEWGTPKEQGKRTDIDDLLDDLEKTRSLTKTATKKEFRKTYVRNSRGIEKMANMLLLPDEPRSQETEFIVKIGEPGSGKTTSTMKEYPGAYWKTAGKWWDRYQGQDTVVLDEFVGWLPYHELMRLGDLSPLLLEVKGDSVNFVAKRAILISNKFPWDWYNYNEHKLDKESLFRRIKEVYYYKKGQEPVKFTVWNEFIKYCTDNNLI